MNKVVALKKTSEKYRKCLEHFKKQFSDVQELTKLYMNEQKQIVAGEWKDSEGRICFNSGYVSETKTVIHII